MVVWVFLSEMGWKEGCGDLGLARAPGGSELLAASRPPDRPPARLPATTPPLPTTPTSAPDPNLALARLGVALEGLEADAAAAAHGSHAHAVSRALTAAAGLRARLEAARTAACPAFSFGEGGGGGGDGDAGVEASAAGNVADTSTANAPTAEPAPPTQPRHLQPASHCPPPPLPGLVGVVGRPAAFACPPGAAVTIADCADAALALAGPCSTLRAADLTRVVLDGSSAPVAGGATVDGAVGCTFYLRAHQVRLHRLTDCDVYLACAAGPVLEACRGVRLAPLGGGGGAGVDADRGSNAWAAARDFDWPRASPSPHWGVLPEGERVPPESAAGGRAGQGLAQ